jgi:DNA polymerase-1
MSPGEREEEEGRYFAGKTGDILDICLSDLRFSRRDCYLTNVLLCRADDVSPKHRKEAILRCQPRLARELKKVKTTHTISALGMDAMQSLCGFSGTQWIGPSYPGKGDFSSWTVFPTLHPAFCNTNRFPAYGMVLENHIEFAWKYANGKLKPWRWPRNMAWQYGEKLEKILRSFLAHKRPVTVDVENAGKNAETALLRCIGIGNKFAAASIPYPFKNHRWESLVRDVLTEPSLPKIFQYAQHDITSLEAYDLEVHPYVFDTLNAHQILAPEMTQKNLGHDLGFIACTHFHMPRFKGQSTQWYRDAPQDELGPYNCKDLVTTDLCRRELAPQLRDVHNGQALFDESLALAKIAIKMRRAGMMCDSSKYKHHDRTLKMRQTKVANQLQGLVGKLGKDFSDFNPGSSKQLHKLFFDKFKIKPRKWSKLTKKPTLDESVLATLVTHPNQLVCTCARWVLAYRRWQKLRGFLKSLPPEGGLVHPAIRVNAARSGRWVFKDPALTILPKPVMKGKKIIAPGLRDIFIARPGYTFIEADYKMLELWILAILANDEMLLDWRASGVDVHKMTVSELTGKPIHKVTKAQRTFFKRFRFGHNYRGSDRKLHASLVVDFPDITLEQVKIFREGLYRAHPRITAYQDALSAFAKKEENDYVQAPLSGRRKKFFGRVKITEVANYPIQMTAADIINKAIREVDQCIDWSKHLLTLQVHDALIGESKKPKQFIKILKTAMERPVELNGKKWNFEVEIKMGKSWGTAKEI